MLRTWFLGLLLAANAAFADEIVPICHGYGCLAEVRIQYDERHLNEIGAALNVTVDAENERKILAGLVGQLYAWAGEQSDVRNDRGGNYADGSTPGKMDCIDHSTSTTRLLKLLEARGNLRWHRVVERDSRDFAWLITVHWSAVIEENDGAARFVVDSWFVDNGQPAVILPLEEWKKGAGPDV
jgi:hypothetical protein